MTTRRVEEYAHRYGLSNNAAKRRLGRRRFSEAGGAYSQAPVRGVAIAGTGKPKQGKKQGKKQ